MPLIECPECHKNVSDQAAACPNCGFPIRAHQNENIASSASVTENKRQTPVEVPDDNARHVTSSFIPIGIGFGIIFLGSAISSKDNSVLGNVFLVGTTVGAFGMMVVIYGLIRMMFFNIKSILALRHEGGWLVTCVIVLFPFLTLLWGLFLTGSASSKKFGYRVVFFSVFCLVTYAMIAWFTVLVYEGSS